MIQKGTILELTMDLPQLPKGTTFTVENIDESGNIVVRNALGVGVVSSDEIGAKFKAIDVVPFEPEEKWSDWKWETDQFGEYGWRSKGFHTQVELWNGVVGDSICSPYHAFDQKHEIDVALGNAIAQFAKSHGAYMYQTYGNEYDL